MDGKKTEKSLKRRFRSNLTGADPKKPRTAAQSESSESEDNEENYLVRLRKSLTCEEETINSDSDESTSSESDQNQAGIAENDEKLINKSTPHSESSDSDENKDNLDNSKKGSTANEDTMDTDSEESSSSGTNGNQAEQTGNDEKSSGKSTPNSESSESEDNEDNSMDKLSKASTGKEDTTSKGSVEPRTREVTEKKSEKTDNDKIWEKIRKLLERNDDASDKDSDFSISSDSNGNEAGPEDKEQKIFNKFKKMMANFEHNMFGGKSKNTDNYDDEIRAAEREFFMKRYKRMIENTNKSTESCDVSDSSGDEKEAEPSEKRIKLLDKLKNETINEDNDESRSGGSDENEAQESDEKTSEKFSSHSESSESEENHLVKSTQSIPTNDEMMNSDSDESMSAESNEDEAEEKISNKSTPKCKYSENDENKSKQAEKETKSLDESKNEIENSDGSSESNGNESGDENGDNIDEAEDEFLGAKEDAEDGDDPENGADPFVQHFSFDLPKGILSSLSQVHPKCNVIDEKWQHLGNLMVKLPIPADSDDGDENLQKKKIDDETALAKKGEVPKIFGPSDNHHIKNQIVIKLKTCKSLPLDDQTENTFSFTPFQNELFSILNNYQDLYFPERNFSNCEDIRFIYTLHLVNHVYKSRLKVAHHNTKIKEKNKVDVTDAFRDSGLVRPKVLVIVPFRDSAYKIVRLMEQLLFAESKGHVMNKKRFIEEYSGNEMKFPVKNPKPKDYELTMSGNTNDDFRFGISVNRSSMKLFAEFYKSDIIIASPLGLRRVIGAEGESERDYDFLASIEMLIVDQAEVILMQNWDHLLHIFDHLHLLPKDSHGTDFSRVRMWCIEGHAKFYRQSLFFSSMELAELASIFNKKCHNYSGSIQVKSNIDVGTISQIVPQVPHRFHKMTPTNFEDSIDKRFEFFINEILPNFRDVNMTQTLIFIPNYFDYVRLRNYFKKETISFTQICEYTRPNKIARARDMFYHGNVQFMLYTERFHFFNRIRIKGIRHIIFYGPPYFPHFYSELCNLMRECFLNKKIGSLTNMSVTVMYCKYDVYQLSRIVSSEKVRSMILSDRSVHMVVTGA